MILSAVVILIVALIAYIWSSRGFFSSLINMLCVIAAGAIAFAFWEPVSVLLLGADSSKSGWLKDIAWGVGLAVPFAASLAILRLGVDKILLWNVDVDGVTNLIGGGVCGLVSGTIVVGVLLISLSYTRLGPEILGYRPVEYENNGSLVKRTGLIYPVDRITAGFYSTLSDSTFSTFTGNTLSRWRPNLADEGHVLRATFPQPDGGSRIALGLDDFEVLGRYTYQPTDKKDLYRDGFDEARNQQFTQFDGQPAAPDSVVEGFVIRFKAGAKEKNGRFVVGNTQVRLIANQNQAGYATDSIGIYPFAMISQAAGDNPALGRWRFDSPRVFIASVGGRDDAPMAFEFVVPRGYSPLALSVKGARVDVDQFKPFATYNSMSARDSAIRGNSITPSVKTTALVETSAITFKVEDTYSTEAFIRIAEAIPGNHILQKDQLKGLEVDEKNKIISGRAQFTRTEISRNREADRLIQVRAFAGTDDTSVVQVRVDIRNDQFGFISNAAANADTSQPPLLIDEGGQTYSALGYIADDGTTLDISFSPQSPVQKVADLPSLSRSSPNQQLILIYRVSKGVKVTKFAIGSQVIANFVPPVPMPDAGR